MKYRSLIVLLVIALLSACAQKETDTSKIDEQIGQYLSLIDARRSPEPDLSRIKELYASLSDILTQSGVKGQADRYFALVETAEHISPPMQGVEKSFQQALVVLIHRELDQIKAGAVTEHADTAYALYGGLRSTVERRGKYFGSETLFTGLIDESFQQLKASEELESSVQAIKTAIDDVYFLSVLYEFEGIAAKRGIDDVTVEEKQIEATIFYDIIKASATDRIAGEKVRLEMMRGGNEMDIDFLKESLRLAFPEKSALYEKKF